MGLMLFYCGIYLLFGLVLGSFLNVCIYRIPAKESIAAGRSHCMSCATPILNRDLIPVVSWIALRGRCRSCGAPISVRYPLVESASGLGFALCAFRFGPGLESVLWCAVWCVLAVVAGIDWDTLEIPNGAVLLLALLGLADAFLQPDPGWLSRLSGALVISLPLLLIGLLTSGIGGGDVKLMAAAGLLLGFGRTLFAFLCGSVAGAVYAVVLLAQRRAGRRSQMPFGPFLALGVFCAGLWGAPVVQWYLSLIA